MDEVAGVRWSDLLRPLPCTTPSGEHHDDFTPTRTHPSALQPAPAHTSSLVSDHTRVSHAHVRPLHPAALAFVPYGSVLVRVRVRPLDQADGGPERRNRLRWSASWQWARVHAVGCLVEPRCGLRCRRHVAFCSMMEATGTSNDKRFTRFTPKTQGRARPYLLSRL